MNLEIKPESFFAIINSLNAQGIAFQWQTTSRTDGQSNRLLTQKLIADDWAGPGVVIHQMLLSDGSVKTTYQIETDIDANLKNTRHESIYAPFTRKMLEVSTANIKEHTATQLGMDGHGGETASPLFMVLGTVVKWSSYGFILYAADVDIPEEVSNNFPELNALLKFANLHGYEFLKIDRDAVELPGFEVFDW